MARARDLACPYVQIEVGGRTYLDENRDAIFLRSVGLKRRVNVVDSWALVGNQIATLKCIYMIAMSIDHIFMSVGPGGA